MIAELKQVDHRVGIVLAVLCGLAAGIVAYVLLYPIPLVGYDFEAFWCGGRAVLAHASPYLNEPLHSCEAATLPGFFRHYPQVTIPAPLPPYAIALFTPLSMLPFALSRVLWWLLQFVSVWMAAVGISKITAMPRITALAASSLAMVAPAVLQGALAPLPIALTIFGALFLSQKRWTYATACLAFSMIEPHMALPACVAAFFFVPQMRARLLLAGGAAFAVMLAAVGPHVALSYFTTILPIHAASEVNNLGQESLTAMLYHLGVRPELALRLGSLQYLLLGLAGLVFAYRLFEKTHDAAWLILLPAAFAVIGGSFIHLAEVAMVLPLACFVFVKRPGPVSSIMLLMLALPLESISVWAPFGVPAAMVCVWLIDRPEIGIKRYCANGIVPLCATAVIFAGSGIANAIGSRHVQQAARHVVHFARVAPTQSASVTWGEYNRLATLTPMWWPERIWLFVPLVLLICLCAKEAFSGTAVSDLCIRIPGGVPLAD
jgi:hypothetical protein